MKVDFIQNTPSRKVGFKSLKGELPKELKSLAAEFTEYVARFMKDKPGYDLLVLTSKNSKNIKMKGSTGLTFLEKARTKKPISEIKSLQDLKDMVQDNYLTTQAGQDVLNEIDKFGRCFQST